MKIPALGVLALCLFVGRARADLQYAFDVTSASGAIQPFSFSFTSANFLADGDTITLTPFTVTKGTDSFTFTQGLVTQNGVACFDFGTAAGSFLGPCSVGNDNSPGAAALLLTLGVAPPTATGVYALGFSFLSEDLTLIEDLTGSLDITTAVPEPASIGLLSVVLAFVGWGLSRRYAPRAS